MGVPTRLGRYIVRRRLGSGGFATVWLAHDEQLDAEVAIKVLADNWGHDETVRRRFLEEGRFLRRVESEHVVQVHDVGELEDGRPFLVLTYADRGTLADRLKKEPLALPVAVDVVVQIGRGLQALHRRGLLHRDVKPANVLFRSTDDDGERAVLSDLGLGKSLDEVSRITLPGGTPSYVAPEQAMGERLDQRADQYSLGAVAYAALTGRSPHQVDGLGAAGRVKAPPPPSSLGFELPAQIDAAIVRALDPDRSKRWPDVPTFTRELVGALDETTHGILVRSRETIELAEPSDDGEHTALSDENQPTIIKAGAVAAEDDTAAATTEPTKPTKKSKKARAAEAAAETVVVESAPVKTPEPSSTDTGTPPVEAGAVGIASGLAATTPKPRKRRRARWVIAAVLALVVGGGAGFVGQRYLADRQLVAVNYGGYSLSVPRAWLHSVAQDPWRPPGNNQSLPAVQISEQGNWGSGAGIFVGQIGVKADQIKLTTDGTFQCNVKEGPSSAGDGKSEDQFWRECGPSGGMLLQRIVVTGTNDSMLIQVLMPDEDRDRAREIANSVRPTTG
ncbi:serine/threonine protein kinase [Kribbella antibiotica]|uniref:non-specific serine/threonine protein kinase n=1 Tax=Kribbella antibiotica TaxID=190195 RepID=A0A4R4ZK23_9ACTN|nr:serine/threonine-protein kinase [Kribbella antibiotica]TDD58490.1 serine/threonine protein kinase [Kribbella antibiotica]